MTALYIIVVLAVLMMLTKYLSGSARKGLPSENGGFKIRGKRKWENEEE